MGRSSYRLGDELPVPAGVLDGRQGGAAPQVAERDALGAELPQAAHFPPCSALIALLALTQA